MSLKRIMLNFKRNPTDMGTKVFVSPKHIELANNIAMQAAKATVLLFTVEDLNGNDRPAAYSSSVLFTVCNRHFLTTAAHTVHDFDRSKLGTLIGHDFGRIGGKLKYFDPNDSNGYDPKKKDLAIFELDQETVAFLSQKYSFLPSTMLDTRIIEPEITRYLVFGYPTRKTKIDYVEQKINPLPVVLPTLGEVGQFYLKNNIDRNNTLAVSVKQKKVIRSANGLIEKLPKLHGISGCGVWFVGDEVAGIPGCKLSGILTGENREKSILYSTRITCAIHIIENDSYFSS